MSRAVYMPVMASGCLVFHVRRVDGNSTGLFFGGLVDLVVVGKFGAAKARKNFGDGSSQCGLSVVNMA
jgi:hypothetical protein